MHLFILSWNIFYRNSKHNSSPCHRLLSLITIVSNERGMNSVGMTIINPRREIGQARNENSSNIVLIFYTLQNRIFASDLRCRENMLLSNG